MPGKCQAGHVRKLRTYFVNRSNLPVYASLCRVDKNYSALNLAGEPVTFFRSTTQLEEEWTSKVLHGRFPTNLKQEIVRKRYSNTYLKAGYLFPETEGAVLAIQDQVVSTLSYRKHIIGENIVDERCRKCRITTESIQHVTAGCTILAPTEYLRRHNDMGKVYHQAIALTTKLLKVGIEPYRYFPKAVLENARYRLYWDTPMVTDRSIAHNRPDVVLIDKERKSVTVIDFIVPLDENLQRAYNEKKRNMEIWHLSSRKSISLVNPKYIQ